MDSPDGTTGPAEEIESPDAVPRSPPFQAAKPLASTGRNPLLNSPSSPGFGPVPRLRFGGTQFEQSLSAGSPGVSPRSDGQISPNLGPRSLSPKPLPRSGTTDLARIAMVAAARSRSHTVTGLEQPIRSRSQSLMLDSPYSTYSSEPSSFVSPLSLTPLTPPSARVSPYWAKLATSQRARSGSVGSGDGSASPTPPVTPLSPLPPMDFSGPTRQRSVSVLVHRRSALSLRHPEAPVADKFTQLRERMRELVLKHHVVTEIDESAPPPPLYQQGDWTMYTNENIIIREQLSSHPGIVKILDQWWKVATHSHATDYVTHDDYVLMNKLIYKALIPEYEEKSAEATAEEDWAVDSGGHKTLSDDAFHNSLYELADIWTLTVDPQEYIEFLKKLLHCVSDGTNFRSLNDVGKLDRDYSSSEETDSDDENAAPAVAQTHQLPRPAAEKPRRKSSWSVGKPGSSSGKSRRKGPARRAVHMTKLFGPGLASSRPPRPPSAMNPFLATGPPPPKPSLVRRPASAPRRLVVVPPLETPPAPPPPPPPFKARPAPKFPSAPPSPQPSFEPHVGGSAVLEDVVLTRLSEASDGRPIAPAASLVLELVQSGAVSTAVVEKHFGPVDATRLQEVVEAELNDTAGSETGTLSDVVSEYESDEHVTALAKQHGESHPAVPPLPLRDIQPVLQRERDRAESARPTSAKPPTSRPTSARPTSARSVARPASATAAAATDAAAAGRLSVVTAGTTAGSAMSAGATTASAETAASPATGTGAADGFVAGPPTERVQQLVVTVRRSGDTPMLTARPRSAPAVRGRLQTWPSIPEVFLTQRPEATHAAWPHETVATPRRPMSARSARAAVDVWRQHQEQRREAQQLMASTIPIDVASASSLFTARPQSARARLQTDSGGQSTHASRASVAGPSLPPPPPRADLQRPLTARPFSARSFQALASTAQPAAASASAWGRSPSAPPQRPPSAAPQRQPPTSPQRVVSATGGPMLRPESAPQLRLDLTGLQRATASTTPRPSSARSRALLSARAVSLSTQPVVLDGTSFKRSSTPAYERSAALPPRPQSARPVLARVDNVVSASGGLQQPAGDSIGVAEFVKSLRRGSGDLTRAATASASTEYLPSRITAGLAAASAELSKFVGRRQSR